MDYLLGYNGNKLSEVATLLHNTFSLQFRKHESIYFGIYLRGTGINGTAKIYFNKDPFEDATIVEQHFNILVEIENASLAEDQLVTLTNAGFHFL